MICLSTGLFLSIRLVSFCMSTCLCLSFHRFLSVVRLVSFCVHRLLSVCPLVSFCLSADLSLSVLRSQSVCPFCLSTGLCPTVSVCPRVCFCLSTGRFLSVQRSLSVCPTGLLNLPPPLPAPHAPILYTFVCIFCLALFVGCEV